MTEQEVMSDNYPATIAAQLNRCASRNYPAAIIFAPAQARRMAAIIEAGLDVEYDYPKRVEAATARERSASVSDFAQLACVTEDGVIERRAGVVDLTAWACVAGIIGYTLTSIAWGAM